MRQAGSVLEHPVVTGVRVAAEAMDVEAASTVWQLSYADVETGLAMLLDVEAKPAALRAALRREAENRDLKSRTRAASVEQWLGDRLGAPPGSGAEPNAAPPPCATTAASHPAVTGPPPPATSTTAGT